MAERKKHLFIDCTNFNWRDSTAERKPFVVKSVRDVTCGQCKGKVLNVIRDLDWSTLSPSDAHMLEFYASRAK